MKPPDLFLLRLLPAVVLAVAVLAALGWAGTPWSICAPIRGQVQNLIEENQRPDQVYPDQGVAAEPPNGIEPLTYSLRVNRSTD
jgi:hypothetical protein